VIRDPAFAVVYYVALAGMGLIFGSFTNVVIYRVPLGLSVLAPPSACPTCGTHISARDNIPVLSWLLLRARCRTCRAPISARYPLVEAGTAVVWLALGWWAWQPGGVDPLLPLLLVLGTAGVALAMIDIDHHRLPDAIVLPLYPIALVGFVLAGLLGGDWAWLSAVAGLGSWLALIGGMWLLSGGRAMGFGDVKLAPVLGATLGWIGISSALTGLFMAFLLGGLVGAALLLGRRAHRGSQIPFGPYLLAGALAGLVFGEAVGAAYLASMGL
jgi:leader peptidase (prepilin peptidase)/N-methyltransferase